MCPRSVEIILGLLRRINQMEKQLTNAEESAQKWECKAAKLQTKVRRLEIMMQQHASRERKFAAALAITYGFVLAGFAVWVFGNLGNNHLLQLWRPHFPLRRTKGLAGRLPSSRQDSRKHSNPNPSGNLT